MINGKPIPAVIHNALRTFYNEHKTTSVVIPDFTEETAIVNLVDTPRPLDKCITDNFVAKVFEASDFWGAEMENGVRKVYDVLGEEAEGYFSRKKLVGHFSKKAQEFGYPKTDLKNNPDSKKEEADNYKFPEIVLTEQDLKDIDADAKAILEVKDSGLTEEQVKESLTKEKKNAKRAKLQNAKVKTEPVKAVEFDWSSVPEVSNLTIPTVPAAATPTTQNKDNNTGTGEQDTSDANTDNNTGNGENDTGDA